MSEGAQWGGQRSSSNRFIITKRMTRHGWLAQRLTMLFTRRCTTTRGLFIFQRNVARHFGERADVSIIRASDQG